MSDIAPFAAPTTHAPATGSLFATDALLPGGWARNVLLEWNAAGHWCRAAMAAAVGALPRNCFEGETAHLQCRGLRRGRDCRTRAGIAFFT